MLTERTARARYSRTRYILPLCRRLAGRPDSPDYMSGPGPVPPAKLSRLPKLPKTVPDGTNQFAGHRLRIVRVESSNGVPAKPAAIGIKARSLASSNRSRRPQSIRCRVDRGGYVPPPCWARGYSASERQPACVLDVHSGFSPRIGPTSNSAHASRAKGEWSDPARVSTTHRAPGRFGGTEPGQKS